MRSPKINYVIAAWSGARREVNRRYPRYDYDRAAYLREHLERVRRYSRTSPQVTVVVPDNPDEPPEFTCYVKQLDCPVAVLRRPNERLSFGSFSYAYETYRHCEFTHYVFVEDDYAFCLDGFDAELAQWVDDLDADQPTYLAVHVRKRRVTRVSYAANVVGIVGTQTLGHVWQKYRRLPGSMPSTFSDGFLSVGARLVDVRSRYRAEHYHRRSGIRVIHGRGAPSRPILLRPMESIFQDEAVEEKAEVDK